MIFGRAAWGMRSGEDGISAQRVRAFICIDLGRGSGVSFARTRRADSSPLGSINKPSPCYADHFSCLLVHRSILK